ncbi:MAG TPA: hypothetical protein VG184_05700 [Acidimicrobiales bacterium]|jgi:hypothetical protein|nr:hypothetical protein [Acidimicrobiales bacterium]
MSASWRRFTGGEAGFAGGLEGLVFGMLVFVLGTVLVANAWGVVDTKLAADAAARQAARTFVEAPDAAAAGAEARRAADETLAGYGRSPARAAISLVAGGFERCRRVTVEVDYSAPLVELPLVGLVGSGEKVTARHSEIVDPFRTALAGTSRCP